ncbi:MAG: type II secretion system F family protein [Chloroflexota bacterium]
MSPVIIILGFVLLAGIGAIAFALLRGEESTDKATQNRLERFVSDFERPETQIASEASPIEDRTSGKLTQNIDEALEGRGFARKISTDLARANLTITVTEYILVIILSIVVTAALAFFIYDRNLIMTLVGAVVGFFLPRFYLNLRKSRRLKAFDDQLGDTINLMASGIQAGYSFLMAMESVGEEMPNPVSEEFNRVVREISLGVPTEQALNNMLRRIPSDDLELLITAVNLSSEVGGNLSEILEIIGHVIRERVRIAGEIKTLTAQGMMGGYVVSFLPVALGLILFAMNQEYLGRMVFAGETQPCGWIMLGVGVFMIAIGFAAIMKIVNIEV